MDEFTLLKAEEASQILRVPLSTLYRLTKQGIIKGIKIGKQWRYKREDILRYFNAGVTFSDFTIEKRQYPRVGCRIACRLGDSTGVIRNISAGGALVELEKAPDPFSVGIRIDDPVELRFDLGLDDKAVAMQPQARIVRISDNNFAVRFTGEIDVFQT
jgi:excisionase family DNA binding protein